MSFVLDQLGASVPIFLRALREGPISGGTQRLKWSSKSVQPLLTVLVPTRNRFRLLEQQLLSLRAILDQQLPGSYEVFIGDNSDVDQQSKTRALVSRFGDNFKYEASPTYLETAEENLCRLISFPNGRYTWFLSDDDGICPSGVEDMVRRLRGDEADILIFNSLSSRDEKVPGAGPTTSPRARRVFHAETIDWSLERFVVTTGFFYYIAGFSSTVVRTSLLDRVVFERYLRISRIYAHVAFLVEIGREKRFKFVNEPLVSFGLLHSDFDGGRHWRGVGIREGGFEFSIWTLLWIRTLQELIRHGALAAANLAYICDMNHHTRLYWPHMLVSQIIEQITLDDGVVLDKQTCDVLTDFLAVLLPREIFLRATIKDALDLTRYLGRSLGGNCVTQCAPADADHLERVMNALRYWQRNLIPKPWFQPLYVTTQVDHDIYHDGFEWLAFPIDVFNREPYLEICDHPTVPGVFHRAPSRADLLAELKTSAKPGGVDLPKPGLWLEPAHGHSDLTELEAIRVERAALVSERDHLVRERAVMMADMSAFFNREMVASAAGGAQTDQSFEAQPQIERPPCPAYELGATLTLGLAGDTGVQPYLAGGWAEAEAWGRWTVGERAALRLQHADGVRDLQLSLMVEHAFEGAGRGCRIGLSANEGDTVFYDAEPGATLIHSIESADLSPTGELEVSIHVAHPKLPTDEPLADARPLGVGIRSVRLTGDIRLAEG